MLVKRIELTADSAVYHVGAHDDGRYDVTSRGLVLDHVFLDVAAAARLLAPLVTVADVLTIASSGPRFAALADALRLLRQLR